MLRNYLKIALRDLWRNKTSSLINIIGLTVGTVCCLYSLMYVQAQSGYDQYHQGATHLYRITTEVTEPNATPFQMAASSPPIAHALQRDFPEIATTTRLFKDIGVEQYLLKAGANVFYESKGYYADSFFLQVFSYHFLEGSPRQALEAPYTVVLSAEIARKLFGNQPALNRAISINGHLYQVTGVFDEKQVKSHIRAHFLMSFWNDGIVDFIRTSDQWVGQNLVYTYVRLFPQAQLSALESKLPAFLQRHGRTQLAQVAIKKSLHLQPVTDIHQYSQLDSELDENANPSFRHLMLLIAGLIQLIACINFMNLNTARSASRAREVGIRKVVGATRQSLISRFLGESLLLATVAVWLAVLIVWWTMPFLNELIGGQLPVVFSNQTSTWVIVGSLILGTGLLAGSYPAFYLSAYQTVTVLKGNFSNRLSSVSLRKGLVIVQFVVSATLIIAVIVISRQLSYLQTKELGFDQQQKIVFPFRMPEAKTQRTAFTNELSTMPQIAQTGGAAYYPSHWLGENLPIFYQSNKGKTGTGAWVNRADEGFLNTLRIPLLAGRNLSAADTNHQVIANEKLLKELSLPLEKAIGQRVSLEYQQFREDYTIIGVVKDFNFRSLKEPMRPLMLLRAKPDQVNYVVADVRTTDLSKLITHVESVWKKLIPGVPFEYSFLGEDLQKQYQADNALLGIINRLALVAVLIACLGLFGLAAFTAERRTKEIGIRKVLGASVSHIVILLSKDFLRLVLLANVIAWPLAYYAMNRWLQDFAYRISIGWWVFGLAGASALVIALLTVSFQAIKAAIANPVKSLRTE